MYMWALKNHENKQGPFRAHWPELRAKWKNVTLKQQLEVFKEIQGEYTPGSDKRLAVDRKIAEMEGKVEANRCLNAKSVVLTYNGPWGVQDNSSFTSPRSSLDRVCEGLRELPLVQELWRDFQKHVEQVCDECGADVWSCSLEVSPETWRVNDEVRVHGHAFLGSLSGRIRTRRSGEFLEFKKSVPNRTGNGSNSKRMRNRVNDSGDFYIQVPKKGSLWSKGSRKPFKDFLVNPEWVSNLLQQEKITYDVAKEMYAKSVKQCQRNVSNLQQVIRVNEEKALVELMMSTQLALKKLEKPSKVLPVVQTWRQQYETLKHRYTFLVLDGKSCCGKTMFALSLEGRDATLDVTCHNTLWPDLKEWNPLQHKAILFDEASVDMVLANKRLFQAPASMIQLASSATNMYSYSKWFHRAKMIVSSNKWRSQLESMGPEDQEWINTNSVYVSVTGPLWEEAETVQPHFAVGLDPEEEFYGGFDEA